jgi:hypothetical protein
MKTKPPENNVGIKKNTTTQCRNKEKTPQHNVGIKKKTPQHNVRIKKNHHNTM